ncbi:MAG: TonB-dependent receptor [Sphingobium sp.]|jgi:iron complex outermembrane receptor protein|nr:TonB-dependent receptor [Sphingobium sp.]MCI1271242.1 TonB-dependent receptor [Sphingobium sp.]MCI1756066.1 TonB-dependent receptor [Sphingobium sp.]MCI2052641.1 TonB-dependent receptor [Sphingobium sp.]
MGALILCPITSVQARPADEIIVTGEKFARPLQATTSSVTLVQSSDITTRGLTRLQDIIGRTANISPANGPAGFSIRGITNSGVSGAGEADTAVIYIDNTPLAWTYLQAAPTRLWDIASVEIWRGPQSTLRGLNSLAGAIMIQSTDPDLHDWDVRSRVSHSDEPAKGFAIAGGGPIQSDQLAVRVALETQSRDGFIHNLTRHTHEDREESTTARLKLLWTPAALSGFSLKLGYNRFRREGGFYRVYARTDSANFLHHPIATDNVPNTTDLDFDSISAQGRYDVTPELSLINETSWSRARERSSFDGDYGPTNAAYSRQARNYRTWTQELRLQIDTASLKGVAGLFYYDRNLASATQSRTNVPTPVSTIAALLSAQHVPQANAIASAYGAALPVVTVDFDGAFPTHVKSYAAFADLRYGLTERLWLLGGFRYNRESTRNQVIQTSQFAGTFPNPLAFGPLAPAIAQINLAVGSFVQQANAAAPAGKRNFSAFLPKFGLQMNWSDDLATSAVVQRGYRSGGLSTNIARAQSVSYDPEYIWNYELSLRSLLLGGKLRLNANAFLTDWRNQQVSVNFGLNSFDINTVNAARSRLYGFEVEAVEQLSDEWSLYASIGHTHTRFSRFTLPLTGTAANLKGTEFAHAPHWTLSGGADFQLHNNLFGSLNASYSSRSFAAVGPSQYLYRVVPHTIVNGRIGYRTERWSVAVEVQNLLDKVYAVYKSPTESRAVLNAPRTFGAEFSVHF